MKYEDLVKMSVKELKDRLKDLNTQAQAAAGKDLDALLEEATTITGILDDVKNRERLAGIAKDAEGGAEPTGGEKGEEVKDKAREERGQNIKDGKAVKFSAKKTFGVKNALSVSQTVTPTHSAADMKETFNDVSSLVDRVTSIPLNGGETYQRGYIKSYGDGAGATVEEGDGCAGAGGCADGTAEGGDYNATEPVFGYVTIEKQKITAYTEEPEEMIKLPNADYDGVVEGSVTKAIRRYMSRQILIGDGTSGKFKGIFHNPTETKDQVIDPATDLSMTAVDDGTLDEIIYSFGGDEDVEDAAVLVLNKKDLKAFAKLRDKQGRKVYTIVNHGNTGTIDGVPYVINSACGAVTDAQTKAIVYCMAYGPLSNYEMAIFSDIDARKSLDYKFKQGQIAYRADIFAGGAVAAHNGFIRVKRPASA